MNIFERPIAIVDVETTGLDSSIHEIIEIGLILINQKTLEILNKVNLKIKPEHIERAFEKSLVINGYNENDWKDGLSLLEAMSIFNEKTKDAIFCSYNVVFDWSFIIEAFKKVNIKDQMDYHRIDLLSMGWARFIKLGLEKFNLNEIAKQFNIAEEPLPHRAINGATIAFEIYKKLIS
ncbi:MAG TPA: exonuclease domain-containing protein [Candidatus Paceibacterota bacterium]|nr:exonuclease domain-containing protein [Candidatus Paceibacterota bacterium]HPT40183.1 exonuclease domain-containing protein [Candidatus Paceibacterota bacterium]